MHISAKEIAWTLCSYHEKAQLEEPFRRALLTVWNGEAGNAVTLVAFSENFKRIGAARLEIYACKVACRPLGYNKTTSHGRMRVVTEGDRTWTNGESIFKLCLLWFRTMEHMSNIFSNRCFPHSCSCLLSITLTVSSHRIFKRRKYWRKYFMCKYQRRESIQQLYIPCCSGHGNGKCCSTDVSKCK